MSLEQNYISTSKFYDLAYFEGKKQREMSKYYSLPGHDASLAALAWVAITTATLSRVWPKRTCHDEDVRGGTMNQDLRLED